MNSPYKFTDPLGLISRSTAACGDECPNSGGSGGWTQNYDSGYRSGRTQKAGKQVGPEDAESRVAPAQQGRTSVPNTIPPVSKRRLLVYPDKPGYVTSPGVENTVEGAPNPRMVKYVIVFSDDGIVGITQVDGNDYIVGQGAWSSYILKNARTNDDPPEYDVSIDDFEETSPIQRGLGQDPTITGINDGSSRFEPLLLVGEKGTVTATNPLPKSDDFFGSIDETSYSERKGTLVISMGNMTTKIPFLTVVSGKLGVKPVTTITGPITTVRNQ